MFFFSVSFPADTGHRFNVIDVRWTLKKHNLNVIDVRWTLKKHNFNVIDVRWTLK